MNYQITFNPKFLELTITIDGYSQFYIDFENLTSSAAVLDAITQVSKKSWASDGLVGALVKEIDGHLNLQRNFCPRGEDTGRKTPKQIKRIVSSGIRLWEIVFHSCRKDLEDECGESCFYGKGRMLERYE